MEVWIGGSAINVGFLVLNEMRMNVVDFDAFRGCLKEDYVWF